MALLKLDKLGARERWGLGIALVVVLVLLVDRLVVDMVANRIQSVRAQAVAEAKELDYNRRVLQTRGPIEAEYGRIEGLLASGLSDSEAIDEIKGEIDDLARETGVSLVSMEHRAPSGDTAGYREYVIEVRKFEGSMQSLLAFLHKVWETPGMMRARKVTVTPGSEEGMLQGSAVISKLLIGSGPAVAGGEEVGDR